MDNELSTRLNSIAATLKDNRSLIDGFDQKILDICDIEDIDKKVEQTIEIARGQNVTLREIDRSPRRNTAEGDIHRL